MASRSRRRNVLCTSRRQTGAFRTELRDSVFIYPDSWGCVDTKYPVNAASVSFNKLPRKKYGKKWFKLRMYWWVQNPRGIMQLTQAHGSVLLQQPVAIKANSPGSPLRWALQTPRGSVSGCREEGELRICHSQLLPMVYLCQDTPDQQTIKPFYKRWLQNQSAKWQQLVEKFHL